MHVMCRNVNLSTGNVIFLLFTLKQCTQMITVVANDRLMSGNVSSVMRAVRSTVRFVQ